MRRKRSFCFGGGTVDELNFFRCVRAGQQLVLRSWEMVDVWCWEWESWIRSRMLKLISSGFPLQGIS
jgi:hypothetical protein